MTQHEKAIKAAEWLNNRDKSIQFTINDDGIWTRASCYIAPDLWSCTPYLDSQLIAEANRLGWAG